MEISQIGALRVITGKYAFVDLPNPSDIDPADTLTLAAELFDREEIPLGSQVTVVFEFNARRGINGWAVSRIYYRTQWSA